MQEVNEITGMVSEDLIGTLPEENIEVNSDEKTEKRKDPTEAELKEYFRLVGEKVKTINIKKGAKEFTFDDGFSCISRDQQSADRKHLNWSKK